MLHACCSAENMAAVIETCLTVVRFRAWGKHMIALRRR